MRWLNVCTLGAALLVGCDATALGPDGPVLPPNPNVILSDEGIKSTDVLATSWAQIMICGLEREAPDTLIKMGQSLDSRRMPGYSLGYWSLYFSKRGTKIAPLHYAYRADNAALPHQTWYSVLSDRQNDAGVAHLRLDTTARNTVHVQRFDPVSGRLSGTFEVTFVFFSGTQTPSPLRNFADTIRMRNGTFDIKPEVIPCIR